MVSQSANLTRVVQGAGTTLITETSGVLHSVFVPVSTAGTIDFYDTNTKAGTAASNLILGTFPTIQGTPLLWEFDWNLKKGLVIVTSGTVNANISYY